MKTVITVVGARPQFIKAATVSRVIGQTTELPVALPLHPRTHQRLIKAGAVSLTDGLTILPPVGYLDVILLERGATVVATDSGGVQKEAYFHGVPCVTLRDETEWQELVDLGWNRLAQRGLADIVEQLLAAVGCTGEEAAPYGAGRAAGHIVEALRTKG